MPEHEKATDTQPESADPDAERLRNWEKLWTPVIVIAAIVPLLGLSGDRKDAATLVIDFGSWFVFLIDLVVHIRLRRRYVLTRWGIFDTAIVLLTFPWFSVIPGATNSEILLIARLARVARIVYIASQTLRGAKLLAERIGKAVIYAVIAVVAAAILVQRLEDGRAGFDSLGDSLWWSVVTITTVGYGDLVPTTLGGRLVGVFLMISGVALLGALAGSLAVFLRLDRPKANGAGDDRGAADAADADLADEIARLRTEVERLGDAVAASARDPDR